MRVLVVEDEPRIAADLSASLRAAGYLPEIAADGEDAWFRGDTQDYDLVVLDLGLPHLDGLAVLKRWRASGRHMPVLVLTARGMWAERVEGIDAGADDYLTKPFQMEEFTARVRALIRRAVGQGGAVIKAGSITLDTRQMKVAVEGIPIAVSPLEYRLLAYLVHHKGRVISPGELIEHLYGDDDARDANALEAAITRLRKKLGSGAIETRRGFGYCISGR
jgi:two-component system, OmpR family, response regulator